MAWEGACEGENVDSRFHYNPGLFFHLQDVELEEVADNLLHEEDMN